MDNSHTILDTVAAFLETHPEIEDTDISLDIGKPINIKPINGIKVPSKLMYIKIGEDLYAVSVKKLPKT